MCSSDLVVPLLALEAGQRVAGHGGVAVADVQLVAGVVDGGGDVKFLALRHVETNPPFSRMKNCKESKSSRLCPGIGPARTGAEYFRGTTLICRPFAGHGLKAAAGETRCIQPDAVTGAPGAGLGCDALRLRGSKTIFGAAMPACFPPPQALCKDRMALTLLFTAGLDIVTIIEEATRFVNRPAKVFAAKRPGRPGSQT